MISMAWVNEYVPEHHSNVSTEDYRVRSKRHDNIKNVLLKRRPCVKAVVQTDAIGASTATVKYGA